MALALPETWQPPAAVEAAELGDPVESARAAGLRYVADLTPGMLEDWGSEIVAASRSTETARRVLSGVRAMLNTARKRGEIATVPFVPV